MSCYQLAKRSLWTCIRSNGNVYNRHCIRRNQQWLIERVYCYCMITRGRMLRGVARNTREMRLPTAIGWDTLRHPPYSPDLAPSDNHLYHSLDNHHRGKFFINKADVRQALTDFFASRIPPSFTARGLNNWTHVGRRGWMPMVITSRTNNRLRYLCHVLLGH
ncbi:histone-lysine N-methyltransferase SETMAR [Trichonephila clavipes]|nr:histone-lysine N-methyltransferase SETMAR [Trichonephila clavipes]